MFLHVCLFLLIAAVLSPASVADAQTTSSPLFADESTLAITIEGPITTLVKERSNDEYYQGLLKYQDADGAERTLDLQFRTRGNFRRRVSTCRFPPVRLNLRKNQVEGTLFDGQNILKLVTHCRQGTDRYEQYVLKEQLAYKILHLHTPASFRTRLLRVNWVDTDNGNSASEHYGFVIEHRSELAERNGLTYYDQPRATFEQLDAEQAVLAAIFEYMVGNTDFSMVKAAEGEDCCHNGELYDSNASELVFVPYDFDMSGIVDAPYAVANPRFKLRGVTSRLYRGRCLFNDNLDAAVAVYLDRQDDVMTLVDQQEGLTDRHRRKVRSFLDRFYAVMADPSKVEKELKKDCVG